MVQMVKRPGNSHPKDLPWTTASIMRAFGGVSAFARAIGVGQQAASEMKRRGRITSRHWARIIEEAAKIDISLRLRDLLAAQTPTKPRKRRRRVGVSAGATPPD
jgi:hypothetical protein